MALSMLGPIVGSLAFTLLFLGLLFGWAPRSECAATTAGQAARFAAAILDASKAEPDEISDQLWPISPRNERLHFDAQGRVRVVSWLSAFKADVISGKKKLAPNHRPPDLWVSPYPQLRDVCSSWGLSGAALEERMREYLGLAPDWEYVGLGEFWIAPDQLFRPCPDPEIADGVCELEESSRGAFAAVSPEYAAWYEYTKANSYEPDGAPWTRLGYSYDWGSSETKVGASEYVAKHIRDAEPIGEPIDPDEYCRGS